MNMWRVTQWLAALWPPRWWYHWRHAAHLIELGETEAVPGAEFIGSMTLDAEQSWPGWWPAPPVDPEPWRAQTAADLAPVALERDPLSVATDFFTMSPDPGPSHEVVLPDAGGWISGPCIDPGPGAGAVPSGVPAPGPDQDAPGASQTDPTAATGTLPAPARHSDLGPQARAVLARYERRFHELWACPWLDLGGLT